MRITDVRKKIDAIWHTDVRNRCITTLHITTFSLILLVRLKF